MSYMLAKLYSSKMYSVLLWLIKLLWTAEIKKARVKSCCCNYSIKNLIRTAVSNLKIHELPQNRRSNCFTFFRNFWNDAAVWDVPFASRIYRSTLKCNMHDDGTSLVEVEWTLVSRLVSLFIANGYISVHTHHL